MRAADIEQKIQKEDRQRMIKLTEEVKGRLREMSMIVTRVAGRPLSTCVADDGAPTFGVLGSFRDSPDGGSPDGGSAGGSGSSGGSPDGGSGSSGGGHSGGGCLGKHCIIMLEK
jgi:hypothetical protein